MAEHKPCLREIKDRTESKKGGFIYYSHDVLGRP